MSEEDRQDARDAARLMHDYAVSIGLPELESDITIYLHEDRDELATIYARVTGWSLEESREHWEEGTAVAGIGWVVANPLRMRESSTRLWQLKKIMAHELFHTYQYGISSLSLRSSLDVVPEAGPRWSGEGIAEFFAYKAMDTGGVLDYARQRNSTQPWGFVEHGKYVDKPLKDMETWAGVSDARGNTYSLFLLAAELLASYAGEDALLRFYILMQPGSTWQEAFEQAFRMPVEEFYERFEEHRSTGFPKLNIPK